MQGLVAYLLETIAGWGRDVRLAATFLTCLALKRRASARGAHDGEADPAFAAEAAASAEEAPRPLAEAARAFPLVGLGVGLVAALVLWGTAGLGWPPLLSALAALLAVTLLTCALHEDGLADTLDGLGRRGSPEDKLAVMRDSRIGTFGVLALVFTVGIRSAALIGMRGDMEAAFALAAACVLSRAALPAVMASHPPARGDGLAFAAGRPDFDGVATAALLGVLLALLLVGIEAGLIAAAAAAAAALLVARFAANRLGGITGDTIGASEQAGQTAALLAFAWVLQ